VASAPQQCRAQRPFPVAVDRGIGVRMRDGIRLDADVYRPEGDGPWPVLIMRLPYGKHVWAAQGVPSPETVAAAGYIVVVQDVRGRFGSHGTFSYGDVEGPDGADTIAWARTLPDADGTVGTFGPSFLAQVQWASALQHPEGLRSILPMVSPNDSAFDGYLFRGGAIEFASRLEWLVGAIGPDAAERAGGAVAAQFAREAADLASGALHRIRPLRTLAEGDTALAHGCRIWEDPAALAAAAETTRGRYAEIDVPVFLIGGWYDAFLGSTLAQYAGMRQAGRRPVHLVVGPWSHMEAGSRLGEVDFGPSASHESMAPDIPLGTQHIRWFDATVRDEARALAEVTPVRLFVMGENRWRSFDAFPPAEATALELYLAADGTLREEVPESGEIAYVYDPQNPAPTVGGATLAMASPAGPYDQRPLYDRVDVVGFTSAPLSASLTVIGGVSATLYAATDGTDTDFVVRVCDVAPDGTSLPLVDGIVRASLRDDFGHSGWQGTYEPCPVEPGRVHEYRISLWATAHTFLPGHRVRVDVTSSSFPRWDPNPNTGATAWDADRTRVATQRIALGAATPSRVHLSVVPS